MEQVESKSRGEKFHQEILNQTMEVREGQSVSTNGGQVEGAMASVH
jgi:hypothetical protein